MKTIDPVEIFLMETKIDYSFVARVMNKLGLLIFFLYLCSLRISLRIIFIWRKLWGNDLVFLCFLVYGPVLWREKEVFWWELMDHGQNLEMSWLCLGDFNDLLRQDEK